MCGILAIVGCTCGNEALLRRTAQEASRKQRHRGPDWSGVCVQRVSSSVDAPMANRTASASSSCLNAFAHERLAINDPQSGKQPLFDSTGHVCATVNGEIYNHEVLEQELLDESVLATFKSKSDCAALPYLFSKHGSSFVEKILGVFAFVISDERTGEFLVARDPLGICPLYVGVGHCGAIWFSSEMKALSSCAFVSLFPPGCYYTGTAQKNVLPTSHSSTSVSGGMSKIGVAGFETGIEDEDLVCNLLFKGGQLIRYYTPSWASMAVNESYPRTPLDLDKLRTTLEAAVESRMMSDVPFGVLLSGGLDSSIIAAIASRKLKEILSSEEEKESTTKTSTTHRRRLWFDKLHSFAIGLEGSPDLKAARIVAEYLGTEHHELIFTPQEGVDAIHDVIYHLETYDVTTIRAATPMYLLSKFIRSLGIKVVLSGEGADELFGGYLYFHKAPSPLEFYKETCRKVLGLHQYDVLRANKAPLGCGVEVRVPFLDRRFVEVAMNCNPEEKMCAEGRIEKYVLRKTFEEYLPASVLWRQKEQFSDGVGYRWIDYLKEHAQETVSDIAFARAPMIFRVNSPETKEAYWYRTVFSDLFRQNGAAETIPGGPSIACSSPVAVQWDEEFCKNADQSGRSVLGVHVAAVKFTDVPCN